MNGTFYYWVNILGMPEDYPKEELQKIYEALPEDLKKAMFSAEVANNISDICTDNDIEKSKEKEIAKYVADVFLGLLPHAEFEKTLKEKLILNADLSRKISREITRLVFLPLKVSLEAIYGAPVIIPPSVDKIDGQTEPELQPDIESPMKKQGKGESGKDYYRELIE